MTKDELLTEGYDYADITGYKGDERETAACAYMRGAMWHQRKVEEAFKQWLSEHIAFTADEENRTILQELWDKINV